MDSGAMEWTSSLWLALAALVACASSIPGLAGLSVIREALREGNLHSLSMPRHWRFTRAFVGICAAVPVFLATASLGAIAALAALCTAALGYGVAPLLLAEARRRAVQVILDESTLHLELLALVLESGGSLTAGLSTCAARAPDGPLRRAIARVVREVAQGAEVHEALRAMDQRLGLRPISLLVTTLRNADRGGFDLGALVRERARQSAAARFARAERQARAAPLKLWATMLLCIAPCTLLVLAWPVAQLLAKMLD